MLVIAAGQTITAAAGDFTYSTELVGSTVVANPTTLTVRGDVAAIVSGALNGDITATTTMGSTVFMTSESTATSTIGSGMPSSSANDELTTTYFSTTFLTSTVTVFPSAIPVSTLYATSPCDY